MNLPRKRLLRILLINFFSVGCIFLLGSHISVVNVEGDSMVSTLYDGDKVVVWEPLFPSLASYSKGELVVFNFNKGNTDKLLVKKIMGVPQDSCYVHIAYNEYRKFFLLNKGHLTEVFQNKKSEDFWLDIIETKQKTFAKENYSIKLSVLNDQQYYVLGENLYSSIDSRYFGPIEKNAIKGKVIYSPN